MAEKYELLLTIQPGAFTCFSVQWISFAFLLGQIKVFISCFSCQQGGESQKAVATEGTGIDWEGKKGDQCIILCVCAPILKAYFVIGHIIS